jgi:hypothetical protein
MDTKPLGDLFGNSCPIGEKDGSKSVIPQHVIDLPKMGVKQGFPAGDEKPQPLNFFKFF